MKYKNFNAAVKLSKEITELRSLYIITSKTSSDVYIAPLEGPCFKIPANIQDKARDFLRNELKRAIALLEIEFEGL